MNILGNMLKVVWLGSRLGWVKLSLQPQIMVVWCCSKPVYFEIIRCHNVRQVFKGILWLSTTILRLRRRCKRTRGFTMCHNVLHALVMFLITYSWISPKTEIFQGNPSFDGLSMPNIKKHSQANIWASDDWKGVSPSWRSNLQTQIKIGLDLNKPLFMGCAGDLHQREGLRDVDENLKSNLMDLLIQHGRQSGSLGILAVVAGSQRVKEGGNMGLWLNNCVGYQISCGRCCKMTYFKLSLLLEVWWTWWNVLDESQTQVPKKVFEGFLWPLRYWFTMLCYASHALVMFYKIAKYSMSNILIATQSTVYNLGMCSESNSFHSNNRDFNCPQQRSRLKTLEDDNIYNKISYQYQISKKQPRNKRISTQNQTPHPPPLDAALWASLTKIILCIDIGSSPQKHRHHRGMAVSRCPVERCLTSESRGGAPWDVSGGSSGAGADLWGFWQIVAGSRGWRKEEKWHCD